jgi:hypothetical protein
LEFILVKEMRMDIKLASVVALKWGNLAKLDKHFLESFPYAGRMFHIFLFFYNEYFCDIEI